MAAILLSRALWAAVHSIALWEGLLSTEKNKVSHLELVVHDVVAVEVAVVVVGAGMDVHLMEGQIWKCCK
jgi:hypothetical protein